MGESEGPSGWMKFHQASESKGVLIDCASDHGCECRAQKGGYVRNEIDGRRIQCIQILIQLYSHAIFSIQGARNTDEHLSKVGIDSSVSSFVGVRSCGAG